MDSNRLGEIFNNLLRIIPEHLAELVKLTTDEKKTVEGSVGGFDFLVNSFWPVVAEKIQQDLEHISSPGNPDEFFKNHQISMKFLNDFEMNLTSEQGAPKLHMRGPSARETKCEIHSARADIWKIGVKK